ncbi:hypothetical protein [Ottowia testudinis]|uniref:PepSY domain-containing protein n=1 Tax=Ottowia testudinis TaxID=2816950 RepID=A0A975CHE0_9BURK|nr:hypothetical protein [Ottowia testudinis]QTD45624.1 hypothetical protein J1M35_01480 [Ottowia testudinis]
MRRGAGVWPAGAVAALLVTACAVFADPSRVAPGTSAAGVVQQLGRPTATYPAAGGAGERLQYTYQPAGQRVFNIDLDEQGLVARVDQALGENLFAQRIRPHVWTRADVLREYGPPARTLGVHNFDGTVWVWRYLDGPTWRLLYIDIDRAGVVRGWSNGDEDLPDPPDVH